MKDYKETVPKRDRRGNRTGYTTGSNAAAAAKAATIALLSGEWPAEVTITLPIGETAVMQPVEMELTEESAFCCMVKDAGDDPDITHGALICARVKRQDAGGINLEGGTGVGRVTLPGIGLPVGDPAINIVPRQQIQENVSDAVIEAGKEEDFLEENGLAVEIIVPEGEQLAKNTLNAKLGILGGISILGTTGKVFAYSTASWRASVIQAVELAATNSKDVVVLTTGGRSERYGKQFFPELPDVAFVQLSVFTGAGFETAMAQGVKKGVFIGMMGKMIKTAQGHFTTHVAGNQVDFQFLAEVCQRMGGSEALVSSVKAGNTGRHFLELCREHNTMAPVDEITRLALEQLIQLVEKKGGSMEIEAILVEFNEPKIIARAAGQARGENHSGTGQASLMERLAENPADAYADDEDGRSITGEAPPT